MVTTSRLNLPLLAENQAQKHVTHNEALNLLDVLIQTGAVDKDLTSPPASPADGSAYIVAASAIGLWLGQDENIAIYRDGQWTFISPLLGWISWVLDESVFYQFKDGTWQILAMIPTDDTSTGFFSNGVNPINKITWRGRAAFAESFDHNLATDGNVTGGSWLQSFSAVGTISSVEKWDYVEDQSYIFGASSKRDMLGLASRTGLSGGPSYTAKFMVLNDNVSGFNALAGYFDAVKNHASAGSTFGIEVNSTNLPNVIVGPTPYDENLGAVAVARLAAGSDASVFGNSYSIGAFCQFINNGAKAQAGIVVEHNAIIRDGESDTQAQASGTHDGYGRFAELPHNIGISWWSENPVGAPGTQAEVVKLTSEVTDPAVSYRMTWTDTALVFGDDVDPDYNSFIIDYVAATEAGVAITPAASGGSPIISPRGAATDINLTLDGKGTGGVNFPLDTKIGVGISTPQQPIDIYSHSPFIRLTDKGTALADGEVLSGLEFYTSDTQDPGVSAKLELEGNGTEGKTDWAFYGGGATSLIELMRLTNTGGLGLGTSDPKAQFHIQSEVGEGATFMLGRQESEDTSAGDKHGSLLFYFSDKSPSSGKRVTGSIRLEASAFNASSLVFGTGTSNPLATNNDPSDYADDTNSLMFLTDAGTVGIGEDDPDAILHINSGTDNIAMVVESTDTSTQIQLVDSTSSAMITHTNGVLRLEADIDGDQVGSQVQLSIDGSVAFTMEPGRLRTVASNPPSSVADTGTPGEMAWDSNYVYVCVASNTWKRTAISTW